MIRVLAHFYLAQGNHAQAQALAQELVQATRQEAGCNQYDLLQDDADANHWVMVEAWASQQALDAHSASAHFTRLVPALAALCTQPPQVQRYAPVFPASAG